MCMRLCVKQVKVAEVSVEAADCESKPMRDRATWREPISNARNRSSKQLKAGGVSSECEQRKLYTDVKNVISNTYEKVLEAFSAVLPL